METTKWRQALLRCLGNFPERVPLEPMIEPALDEGAYTRARVTYGVEPGERVAAWLLVPQGEKPADGWPAILAIHQHGGQYDLGKSELVGLVGDAQYAYAADLCRRGYVVLCPDMLCFEERRPASSEGRDPRELDGFGYERHIFTSYLLIGSCLQTKYLHDLTCAIDFLTTYPGVNGERLGVIGHSLGGQETLWLMWYDPRVTVGVSSCGFSLVRTLIRDSINHNFALYLPGLLEICDLDTLVASLAPRPFLFTAGETDAIFPIDGVRAIATAASESYRRAGVPARFQAILFPGGHSLPADVKSAAYAFLDRWLK
ncbi:MAG TPA: dienelactone hydrolase family protein [Ktedonobacteraceae bacterium]|nr:dienelactone hydrolase family protein [Ktedonobacteraceae bacterium]